MRADKILVTIRDGKGRFVKGSRTATPGKLGYRAFDISELDLRKFYIDKRQSMREIGERYGCSINTIEHRLNEYGIPIRTGGETLKGKATTRQNRFKIPIPRETLRRLYIDNSLSCGDIGKKYGCDSGIIRHRLDFFGIPRRNHILAMQLAIGGDRNTNWRGGITAVYDKLRNNFKYRLWRSDVFHRDNFVCQDCSKRGGMLHAHHLKGFGQILQEYNIETYKEGLACEELWDINNGVTLCKNCHHLRHIINHKGEING